MKCQTCNFFIFLLLFILNYQSALSEKCSQNQNESKGAGKLQKMLAEEKHHMQSLIHAREKEREVVLDPGKCYSKSL